MRNHMERAQKDQVSLSLREQTCFLWTVQKLLYNIESPLWSLRMSFYIKEENRLFCFHNLQGQNYRWKSIIKLYVFRSSFVLYCFLNSKGSWSVRIILGGRLLVLKTAEEWWRKLEVVVTMSGGWYCICNHYWRLLMCVSKLMVLSRKTRRPQVLDWAVPALVEGGNHGG